LLSVRLASRHIKHGVHRLDQVVFTAAISSAAV
jgi:hypothetical protein